jgi:hypoxanthine-DNA glycosylase
MKSDKVICSFPPVGAVNGHTLILGSMPGEASLKAGEYYAHPQNSFWRIMGELFGAGRELAYKQRLGILADHGITLWESLQSCIRQGSLDSDISEEIPNDFRSLFAVHSGYKRIFFNGAKAEQSFKKLVLPTLGEHELLLKKLPSTSPAHAGMSFHDKLRAWKVVKENQKS